MKMCHQIGKYNTNLMTHSITKESPDIV